LLAGIARSLLAQTVLKSDHNAYRAGDRIIKQQVEYKDPGSSGKELTWDFSMLQPVNEEYSLDYFIPDSARMDILCGLEHRTRYYYLQQRDSIWATGFENSTTRMNYLQPELKMRFPFGYGDTLYSNFEGDGQYSRRLDMKVKGYTRVKADAAGELKLPGFETVKKTLRVHTQRYYTRAGRDSTEMLIDAYAWYAEGIRYPVFESVKTNMIRETENRDGQDTTLFTTSFYYPPELQTSQETLDALSGQGEELTGAAAVFTEATILPNPVTDFLNISYKLSRQAQIRFSVHNTIGMPVAQTAAQNQSEGYHNVSINMAAQIVGNYSVYVYVDDMLLKMTVIKQ
jgi:hypothetical protein